MRLCTSAPMRPYASAPLRPYAFEPIRLRAHTPMRLLPLPAGAASAVFEQYSASGEIVADPVGFGKVPAAPGGVALLDETLDLLWVDRRPGILGLAQRDHAEDPIKMGKPVTNGGDVRQAELPAIDR